MTPEEKLRRAMEGMYVGDVRTLAPILCGEIECLRAENEALRMSVGMHVAAEIVSGRRENSDLRGERDALAEKAGLLASSVFRQMPAILAGEPIPEDQRTSLYDAIRDVSREVARIKGTRMYRLAVLAEEP